MKHASGGLIALLNGASEYFIADVLTILPAVGSPIYLTSAATDITVVSQVDTASHVFKSGGTDPGGTTRPTFTRGAAKTIIGTQVDNLDVTLMCSTLALLNGFPWTQQATQGFLDGALIALERTFSSAWGDWSNGTLITFWGRVASVRPSRNVIAISVASDVILFQRPMPKNVYQPGCLHNLYDSGCTLVKAALTVSAHVTNVVAPSPSFFDTNLTQANQYFEQGAIKFTSGALNGLQRTVKTYFNAAGGVAIAPPFPVSPANGDTFDIWPGCDKQQATCSGKFANLTHFRGFPYVPTPESGS